MTIEAPAPVRRALITRAVPHRQPKPRAVATGQPPWWATKPREGFTEAGAQATEHSRHQVTGLGLPARE